MPPPRSSQAASQRRATQSQNEHVYELGKVGRKTGVTLPDNGERDEYGFEDPNIFSSPEKEPNGANGYDRETPEDSDEQDMDLDDGSEMGPATIRKLQERKNRPSLPRARSPIKTNLKSPARRNPHLGPTSSPMRGSIIEASQHSSPQPVKRRLDFSKDAPQMKPVTNGNSRLNASKAPNGRSNHSEESGDDDGDEDDEDGVVLRRKQKQPAPADEEGVEGSEEGNGESMQVLDMGDDDGDLPDPDQVEPEAEEEEEEEEEAGEDANEPVEGEEEEETEEVQPPPAARRGRKPKEPPATKKAPSQPPVAEQVKDEPAKKKRGRPAKNAPQEEPAASSSSPKRTRSDRNSLGNAEEEEEVAEEREPKRPRTEKASSRAAASAPLKVKKAKAAAAAPPPPQKGKPGRKRKSSGVGVDSPVVQRGPPLPRARGLVSMRREGTDSARTTRSGRISVKPLEFWKGEHYEFDDDPEEVYGEKRAHFVFNKVKGIVRAEEPEPQHHKAAKKGRGRPPGRPSKGGRPSTTAAAEAEPEEEPDEWEEDPGRVVGECFYWYPEYQEAPPEDEDQVQVVEEELAISSAAINLRDIKDATFKFAKTLTLPFFGAGVVDLPPGSEKHPKNSRKMQMVFFVHTGSVTVTIADVNTFRITKGGMWFVPRGNRYGIKNEGDKTARLFFAQGCEVHWAPEAQE